MTPQPHGGTNTAYGAGIAAYRAGQPLTANPHKIARVEGDTYPGAQAMWWHGWLHAKHMAEHSQNLQRKFATLQVQFPRDSV